MSAVLTLSTLTILRLVIPFGLVLLLGTLAQRYDGARPGRMAVAGD